MSPRVSPGTRNLLLSAALLLGCAVLYALDTARFSTGPHLRLLLMMIVPVGASLSFVLVGGVVPSLLAGNRLGWPHNVTLPIVFAALMQLWALLASHGPNPLVRHEAMDAASRFWQHPKPLIFVVLAQVVVLSLVALLNRSTRSPE